MTLYVHEKSVDLDGCGPKARFLLEAMVRRFLRCPDDEVALKAKTIAQQFRLEKRATKLALDELVEKGKVSLDKQRSGRQGRPGISYRLASMTLTEARQWEQVDGIYAATLEYLFSPEDFTLTESVPQQDEVTELRKLALSPCNRFLLATLLAHADRFGSVEINKRTLRRLTGFSEASLRYRLKALTKMRLIIACVPGLSSAIFPGKKVDSTYFLDVGLGNRVCEEGYMLVRQKGDPELWCCAREQILVPPAKRVAEFLSGQRDAVLDVLRFRCIQYASWVLSHHGFDVEEFPSVDDAQLRERIAADFQRPKRWKSDQTVVLDQEWAKIIEHFYQLAFVVATKFIKRTDLDDWKETAFKEMYILPSGGRTETQVFLVLCRAEAMEMSQTDDTAP